MEEKKAFKRRVAWKLVKSTSKNGKRYDWGRGGRRKQLRYLKTTEYGIKR